jgi:type I restriction enzyme S subunit
MTKIQIKQGWQEVKLGDILDNSKTQIKKNTTYDSIPMELLEPGKKYVSSFISKVFSGSGTKFIDGDVVFARITPCLQNRKIAKVRGLKGGVGFGSTEYFIFRANKDISNSDYIYYLTTQDCIVEPAIKSMVGASGRQRANETVVRNLQITLPPLPIQNKIAEILCNYDDLIEANNRRIKILETQAAKIYTEWFVHYRYPGHENVPLVDSGTDFGMIPEGWEVRKLDEILVIKYGKTLPKTKIENSGLFNVYGAGGKIGFYSNKNCDERTALITCRGNGSGVVWRTEGSGFITNNSFILVSNTTYNFIKFSFIFYLLKSANIQSAVTGSAQPQITIQNINYVEIVVPDKVNTLKFQEYAENLYDQIDILLLQNQNLKKSRDLLIPQLVGGLLEV